MQHAPRDSRLDDSGQAVGVPVGEAGLALSREDEAAAIDGERRVEGAVPSDAAAIGDDKDRIVLPSRVGERAKWPVIDLLNSERFAPEDRFVAIKAVRMVDEEIGVGRATEIENELESDW